MCKNRTEEKVRSYEQDVTCCIITTTASVLMMHSHSVTMQCNSNNMELYKIKKIKSTQIRHLVSGALIQHVAMPHPSAFAGGPGRTGIPAVLRGVRLRDPSGTPAEPHPLLHPRQGDQQLQDGGEMGSFHQCGTQEGLFTEDHVGI